MDCSKVIHRYEYILYSLWGHFCTQDGLRTKQSISLDLGPYLYGKRMWESVRKNKPAFLQNDIEAFQVYIFLFRKNWKGAEGRDLLNFSFLLFWKGCRKSTLNSRENTWRKVMMNTPTQSEVNSYLQLNLSKTAMKLRFFLLLIKTFF